jgi:hypothetical protein
MKRIQTKEAAQKEHNEIREKASFIERQLTDLTAKISQIQRFYREQASYAEGYDEQRQVRSAENELIRLTRKLSSIQPVLRHLSSVRFIESSAETEKISSNQSVNKIDKNVRASILKLKPEDEAESGMTNG